MNLYQVHFDGDDDFVLAASFGGAVELWTAHTRELNGADFDDEPESVLLLRTAPPGQPAVLHDPGPVEQLGKLLQDDGVREIATERLRQIEDEGYDAEHDDQHRGGLMLWAADELLRAEISHGMGWRAGFVGGADAPEPHPWKLVDKPWDSRRRLAVAGALIAAEMERVARVMDRVAKGEIAADSY